ncbi:hypothetical protein HU200_029114 [Digitaria exilis]|uniref:DUF1618 domain-containing protein n=1 Tax=Digitaria exilis TaxID=1010633 RepID=A0A835C4G7_9POAL|nr:hypothetical protein HU200_029114 [Digitaria exilis]CAB3489283.1 unnamed protein product [Digitaria exilis]
METLTTPGKPSDPPAASPRWVLLEPYVNNKVSDDPSVPNAKTTAASCTSTGKLFTLSFALAAPPATSTYCCEWMGGWPGDGDDAGEVERRRQIYNGRDHSKNLHIIAAHDDCVLIHLNPPEGRFCSRYDNRRDYFLYESGAGRTPPWLSLLPGCYFSKLFHRDDGNRHVPSRIDEPRSLNESNTAVVRLVGGEVLVAQLEVIREDHGLHNTAELCVLRPGRGEWKLKQLHIVHTDGGSKQLPDSQDIDATVAVGVRFVCWVDNNSGFYLHDMGDETSSKLVYIPLPIPMPEEHHRKGDRAYVPYGHNLGAAGLYAVRFVSVAPRCCCGGHGKTSCDRSRFAFNVTTWTLRLKVEGPMTWVKDGVLDCDELWQLPNYGCLPRVPPKCPIVSADNPNIICFALCEDHHLIDNADETVWLLEIDTRRKVLLSVVRHGTGGYYSDSRLPAKISW